MSESSFLLAEPLRVAVGAVSLSSPLTGIGQYTRHLVRELAMLGAAPHCFLGAGWSEPPAVGAQPSADGPGSCHAGRAPAWRTAARGLLRRSGLAHLASRAWQAHRFRAGLPRDAALYHETNFLPFCYGALPTVLTAHDLSWLRHPETHPAARVNLLHRHFPRALARADRVIVVSDFVRAELLALCEVDPGKIRVVHNGVAPAFQPRPADALRPVLARHGLLPGRYLLALGTLEPRKRLSTALRAHQRLPAALRRHVPLVLAGIKGWLTSELEREMAPAVARGEVRVAGYIADADLPSVVAGACAMVYPSIYEGFGLPPLEAMACGVPVICSDRSALPGVVGDGGVLLDPDDIDGFSAAMLRACEDSCWRTAVGARALRRAAGFSWQRCARETLDVYGELLRAGRG
ncbi:glycosyltransferase family 4 protein [Cupriavidus alkaliphilus]|uniref:glycosyltransferase family 4 protein n=1 Tax=Cupriavidus alkaliphilus TaxID=942866 RepID=UPI000DC58B23|nr:glycosyltransferase family 1 protein [Cupriavidus alkaliphilus]RAS06010.1 alpha-1,3-rhamnosyl/mannosyltransferase [Cupriavidus alkaliphilus]